MATQVQNRRGTTAEHATFTGAVGEVTVDTTKDTVVVHDGSTAGGAPLLREDQSNLPTSAPTTGIYNASGSLAISTGGSGRLFVDAGGRVGVGSTAPDYLLTVGSNSGVSASPTAIRLDNTFTGSPATKDKLKFYFYKDANESYGLTVGDASDFQYWAGGSSNGIHRWFTSGSERARIDSSGRLLVGTSSSSAEAKFIVQGGATAAGGAINIQRNATTASAGSTIGFINFTNSANNVGATISADGDGTWSAGTSHPTRLVFSTTADGASSPTERMRIKSNGFVNISNTGNVTTGTTHYIHTDLQNAYALSVDSSRTSGNVNGVNISFTGYSPNSTAQTFLVCADTTATRAEIRANGGLANFQANNVNLSDRNAKKDISPAAGTWDCIKQWEIVNYRYKDQLDDADLNLGVIAQQVAESCPEVITVFEEAKDDQPKKLGVKEQQMYWMAIKALQEAMSRIETLEAEVATLKAS